MPVSKSLRFQILRRDDYRCHYCGATPEAAALRVDHVIPEALGGPTEAGNLVTACHDCNAGKAATPPDAAIVAEVDQRKVAFAEAMEQAARELRDDQEKQRAIIREFMSLWDEYLEVDYLPGDFDKPVLTWLDRGLTMDDLRYMMLVTATKPGLYRRDQFRYFAGCCWRRLTEIEQRAAEILAELDGEVT